MIINYNNYDTDIVYQQMKKNNLSFEIRIMEKINTQSIYFNQKTSKWSFGRTRQTTKGIRPETTCLQIKIHEPILCGQAVPDLIKIVESAPLMKVSFSLVVPEGEEKTEFIEILRDLICSLEVPEISIGYSTMPSEAMITLGSIISNCICNKIILVSSNYNEREFKEISIGFDSPKVKDIEFYGHSITDISLEVYEKKSITFDSVTFRGCSFTTNESGGKEMLRYFLANVRELKYVNGYYDGLDISFAEALKDPPFDCNIKKLAIDFDFVCEQYIDSLIIF